MFKGFESILIGSENAGELAKFYREVVGLKQTMEAEMGDHHEKVFGFATGNSVGLAILDHSKVKGKNVLPDRIMFNLEVDDIEKEVKRLKTKGLKPVTDIYHVENYGLIVTFKDTDGNYFQLVKTKE